MAEVKPVTGLLYSQIGYEAGEAKRVIVRAPSSRFLEPGALCILRRDGLEVSRAALTHWGELWNSSWWVARFDSFRETGTYSVHVVSNGAETLSGQGLRVGSRVLWDSTWEFTGVDQLERRARLSQKGAWYDAGALWHEANSHAAMLIGLSDLLEIVPRALRPDQRERVERQIVYGCEYLMACQDEAAKLGYGDGPISHDLIGHENVILPADAAKMGVALARAGRLLAASRAESKAKCLDRSARATNWLLEKARPQGAKGFSRLANGAPEDFAVPEDWMTCDLLMMCWASFELALAGRNECRERAVALATRIMARQVPGEKAEDGLYGHFYLFDATEVTQKAWTHNLSSDWGTDVGATFPFYVLPLLEMARAWPDHADARKWLAAVRNFAYGFFLPACRRSPFSIHPLGVYGKEGLLWFCGTWHGMNAVYGLAAAQALEFESAFQDPSFREIAVGNLQWIAGLNAGVTSQSLLGSHMFSMEIPEGVALPCSMLCGIGNRWAGPWLNTRGAIANGFSVGDQFKFDVKPARASDGPHSFTDEDWITHAGGWLSGLARLRARI